MEVDFSAWHYHQKCNQECGATSAEVGDGRMIGRKLFAYSDLRTGARGARTPDLLHAMQYFGHAKKPGNLYFYSVFCTSKSFANTRN